MSKLSAVVAAVAGALSLMGSGAPAAPAHTMTIESGMQTSAAFAPLAVHCRTGLRPVVALAAKGRPGTKVPFTVFINNVAARKGTLIANSSGVFSTSAEVVDNHRNSARLMLISHVVVDGVVAPACTKPVTSTTVTAAAAARG